MQCDGPTYKDGSENALRRCTLTLSQKSFILFSIKLSAIPFSQAIHSYLKFKSVNFILLSFRICYIFIVFKNLVKVIMCTLAAKDQKMSLAP